MGEGVLATIGSEAGRDAAAPAASGAPGTPKRVVLLGNPNVGKSALFNALTGLRATVSNYPGTTVEVYRGRLASGAEVVDSPGLNSLVPLSEDEQVTWDLVRSVGRDDGSVVVQVADAKNLRRALLITLQLGQLEVPDGARAEHARRGGGPRDPPRPARARGGARHPGARDGRDAVAGAGGRPRGAAARARAAQPRADARGRGRAGAGAPDRARARAGRDARVPVALPRGPARPRRRDHAAARDRGRDGRGALVEAPRPHRHPPGVGLAGARPRALRALPVRRCLRRRHARQPDGEGPLPRIPQPLGGVALHLRAVGLRAGPLRRRVRRHHHGPLLRPRDRAADRPHVLHRVRAPRGLGLPAAARGDERPCLPAHGPEREGRPADGARPRLRHDGDSHHAHPARRRRSVSSRRSSSPSACRARRSSV